MNEQVIIIGSGGHAAELRDYIRHYNSHEPEQQIVAENRVAGQFDMLVGEEKRRLEAQRGAQSGRIVAILPLVQQGAGA